MIKNISLLVFLVVLVGCSPKLFKDKWAKKHAPEIFKARFETTKGNFDITSKRHWSPKAVDRLYQLISSEFYTDIAIFRVVPNFVAQFGIHNDSILNTEWRKYKVPDEPVLQKNLEGAMAFARSGKETRTTQLFINLKSNSPRLDTLTYNGVKGFPVIAKVTNGMDVVKSLYSEYAEKPSGKQNEIQKKGNAYLRKEFPKLDYIKRAYLLK